MVIANARRYRDERRARDDLETLINTSPVGVVVFDATTGSARSFNRAARHAERRRRPATRQCYTGAGVIASPVQPARLRSGTPDS